MQANNLSKTLTPKAPAKAVTYRLLAAGRVDRRHCPSGIPMCPSHQSFRGEEIIYDPGDKVGNNVTGSGQKVLRYVTGMKPDADGKPQPVIGDIEFAQGGVLVVNPTQTNLYEFLERSNYNASNPYRNTAIAPIFERLDPEARAVEANEADDVFERAVIALRELSDERKLEFAAAKQLARADDSMPLVVRALRIYVKANPAKFLEELGSPEVKARAVVAQGLELNLIQYDPAGHSYKWREQGVLLYQVPQGFDGPTKLMEYLLSAGAQPAAQFKELEKQVAAAVRGK